MNNIAENEIELSHTAAEWRISSTGGPTLCTDKYIWLSLWSCFPQNIYKYIGIWIIYALHSASDWVTVLFLDIVDSENSEKEVDILGIIDKSKLKLNRIPIMD